MSCDVGVNPAAAGWHPRLGTPFPDAPRLFSSLSSSGLEQPIIPTDSRSHRESSQAYRTGYRFGRDIVVHRAIGGHRRLLRWGEASRSRYGLAPDTGDTVNTAATLPVLLLAEERSDTMHSQTVMPLGAHARDGIGRDTLETWFDDYATTPINRAKLMETVYQHRVCAEAAPTTQHRVAT